MANLSYIPSFYFYRFADAVSGPYTALNAYSSGLIDARGNIKGSESSIDPFEYFVIKIKKIFDQLPPGTTKYKLQNLMGTLQVFNEEAEQFGITKEQFNCLVESHVMLNAEDGVSYLNLLEDMSTGSAGGGPGTLGTPAEAPGANKGNVSGYDPVMGSMLTRSSPVNMFPSIEMFNVSKDEFNAFKAAKAWKQLQDSKTKKYLQRFQRRNKAGKMAIRDEESGEIFFIPYNEKSFIEENNLTDLSILNEDVKTSKEGYHAGSVLERLLSQIGTQEDYDISELSPNQTEYVGRMVDWVNGFHAASTSGEEGHAEQWIDLGFKNSLKKASRNDSAGPDADPDGFRYDPTSKSTNFQDRIVKVDYGTDRKPVGELSRKRKGIELQGEIIPLPTEKSKFKKEVRELIQSPEIERRMRSEMETQIQTPQTIAHKTPTNTKKLLSARGFVSHPTEQLKQIVQSGLFGINPAVGKKTENEPHGRQTVKSLDLRVRSQSSPSTESDIGYDEIRSMPGGDAPKEAISVSLEALDHLFDQIPDAYVGQKGVNKDTLRQRASKILAPHIKRGRYPLELPSSKTISV